MCDSDSILRYQGTPFSVTIYGAGVIGCEYASIFLGMGVKVTLINTQDRLLSFMDEEIAEALSYHLRDQGCIIRHNEQFDDLEARERRCAAAPEIRPQHQDPTCCSGPTAAPATPTA